MIKRIIFLLIFSMLFQTQAAAESSIGAEVGNQAPDFELQMLNGDTVKLSDYKGKRVMLNFWATWCPPCRVEMPDMQQFHENSDVVILAVNLTDTEINQHNVSQFINEFELTFPIALDSEGKAANLYKINPIPTTFMIDTNGIIQYKQYGAMSYKKMAEEFEKME